jgi:hypothetical protein
MFFAPGQLTKTVGAASMPPFAAAQWRSHSDLQR